MELPVLKRLGPKMNNKNIEKMIPLAMDALSCNKKEKQLKIVNEQNEIPSNYTGYVAAFAATVIQSGLLPTLTFYNQPDKSRQKIISLFIQVLNAMPFGENLSGNDLLKDMAILYQGDGKLKWKSYFLETATACKLAMKTFKKAEPEKKDNQDD